MDFGLHLGHAQPEVLGDRRGRGRPARLRVVWVPEHLVVPLDRLGEPPRRPRPSADPAEHAVVDVCAVLGMIAGASNASGSARTSTTSGSAIPSSPPAPPPPSTCSPAAGSCSASASSWLKAEWDAVGLDFSTRGRRVDEAIEVCRRLWTEEAIEHHGEFFDFGPTNFEPKPVRPAVSPSTSGRRPRRHPPRRHRRGRLDADEPHARGDARVIAHIKSWRDAGRTDPIEFTFSGESRASTTSSGSRGRHHPVVYSPWVRSREAIDGMRRFAEEVIEPSKSLG